MSIKKSYNMDKETMEKIFELFPSELTMAEMTSFTLTMLEAYGALGQIPPMMATIASLYESSEEAKNHSCTCENCVKILGIISELAKVSETTVTKIH